MPPTVVATEEALLLRDEGLSFAAIATILGLARPSDACDVLIATIDALPAPERRAARRREQARLSGLASSIAQRPNLDAPARERLLATLEQFRVRVDGLDVTTPR